MGYVGIVVIFFIVELVIKNSIEKNKTEETYEPILKGRIIIRKYHNLGAFLNLGSKKRKLVSLISVFFTILMLGVFIITLTQSKSTMLKIGLSFLLGGAFSNTYDRLKRKYVVDYFSIASKSPRIYQIIFNISDFFIAIGALISALVYLIQE